MPESPSQAIDPIQHFVPILRRPPRSSREQILNRLESAIRRRFVPSLFRALTAGGFSWFSAGQKPESRPPFTDGLPLSAIVAMCGASSPTAIRRGR
jgi:hypothetical protein